jgi:hypothetical protein
MTNQLILAIFENEVAADEAVIEIKRWDKVSEDVRLGAIGVMVKDDKGRIKTHKLGERRSLGGAALFGLAALLTGGTVIGLGVVGGMLAGAGIGGLIHKGVKMSKQDLHRLNQALDGGKAAVGVMADAGEAKLISVKLGSLGGELIVYEVTDEVVEQVKAAAESLPEEEPPAK